MQARLVAGLVGMAVWTLGAQAPDLSLRIVSPGPDTYLSGPVLLKALVEPAPRAREAARVLFYADGRLVCNIVDVVRAECPWDAGAEVKEHLIRVVADLDGGGRLVSTARTKALDLAERVTVDVVQLTAVVNDGTRFVKGLARDRFRVLEDGVPQTIDTFQEAVAPISIMLAVDASGSMLRRGMGPREGWPRAVIVTEGTIGLVGDLAVVLGRLISVMVKPLGRCE